MAKKLYVGNLPHEITDSELQNIFEPCGSVVSAQVIVDRETRRSKGFGFVEMSTEDEANEAIEALNNKEVNGRALTVNIARPRENRSEGFRGGGGGGGFRGGNRNGNGGGGRRY
jgi:RNA recognition motif-containing protein